MIPRKKLDIGWKDLLFGLASCLFPESRQLVQGRLEKQWATTDTALATLSVRSGFDLVLGCLGLPYGSEILVSAITIRDMVGIIEQHGLRAVPVDIDPDSGALRMDGLAQAVSPRSRAILVAHLFGSRMDMAELVEFAGRHGLLVFEDCAQAFAADGYKGHPGSDVAMFSFGPIKTATALGGALLRFRDNGLCNAARRAQEAYPVQPTGQFFQRILKYAFLKALSWRLPFSLFAALCKGLGTTHDRIISKSVRGFAGGDLLAKIRQQPSAALLALLERRLQSYTPDRIRLRIDVAVQARSYLPNIPIPGGSGGNHTHWVFPVLSEQPDRLVRRLWEAGFDATRGTSSLYAVPDTVTAQVPVNAARTIDGIVYLPVWPGVSETELRSLGKAVLQIEQMHREEAVSETVARLEDERIGAG